MKKVDYEDGYAGFEGEHKFPSLEEIWADMERDPRWKEVVDHIKECGQDKQHRPYQLSLNLKYSGR